MVQKKRFGFTVIILAVVLVISMICSLRIGVIHIDFMEIIKLLLQGMIEPGALSAQDETRMAIIIDLRLPRTVMSALCGAGLALSGVIMQALVRNPLGDPYILGISSGAALGATASVLLGLFGAFHTYGIAMGAFVGAMATTFAVFSVALRAGCSQTMTHLILAGVAFNAICGAFTSLIVYMAKDIDGIRDVSFWLMGSMNKAGWNEIRLGIILFVIVFLYAASHFRTLNASLLGDEMALILGINLGKRRIIFLALVAVLVSSVVASVGIVGFIGLVVPHIVRLLTGNNHLKLIPYSALAGAILVIWCDILSRVILNNTELPIGILTAIVGGPFFLYIMNEKKTKFGDNT